MGIWMEFDFIDSRVHLASQLVDNIELVRT